MDLSGLGAAIEVARAGGTKKDMEELGQTLRGALDTLKEQPVDELLAFYQSLDFTTDTLAAAYILYVCRERGWGGVVE